MTPELSNTLQAAPTTDPSLSQSAISSLSSHIAACFTEAQSAKVNVIERLLECERQRRGEYSPRLKAQIAAIGGQEIFMRLTDIKCRAADSWIKDVMQNHSEATWALTPTQEPTLPQELMAEVKSTVMEEASQVAAMGVMPSPQVMALREKEIADEAETRVKEIATDRCMKMENRIIDKLQEGGWREALAAMIYDFTTYPAVFMKGPILRKKKVMKWDANFKPAVTEEVVIEVDRISPWDIFPSSGAVTMQDGFLVHRHKLSRQSIRHMTDMPGASKPAIRSVLTQYRTGYKTTLNGDTEHDSIHGKNVTWGADGMIEALEYWGPASGFMLKEWGMSKVNGKPIDELDEYQINAWKVAGYVIRVQINPDPLGQRPYSKACFEDIPGQFWGVALPEMMSDVQIMVNASGRSLAMNMGIASGPQVEVQIDRLPAGEVVTAMYPWKVWQTTSDRTGNGQPAIKFFQPNMNAAELLQVYTYFSKIADEVTGVPNYIYGSSNVSGAGRTASGLAMLMENAAKGIKHAILALDAATSEVIVRIYNHLMMFDPDTSIKGDMNVVAAGAIGAMLREQKDIARKEFLATSNNPTDMAIIGLPGRAYMLRETAKGLFSDINKVVPDPDKMKMAQAMQPGAMPPPPGGAQASPQPQQPAMA